MPKLKRVGGPSDVNRSLDSLIAVLRKIRDELLPEVMVLIFAFWGLWEVLAFVLSRR